MCNKKRKTVKNIFHKLILTHTHTCKQPLPLGVHLYLIHIQLPCISNKFLFNKFWVVFAFRWLFVVLSARSLSCAATTFTPVGGSCAHFNARYCYNFICGRHNNKNELYLASILCDFFESFFNLKYIFLPSNYGIFLQLGKKHKCIYCFLKYKVSNDEIK